MVFRPLEDRYPRITGLHDVLDHLSIICRNIQSVNIHPRRHDFIRRLVVKLDYLGQHLLFLLHFGGCHFQRLR